MSLFFLLRSVDIFVAICASVTASLVILSLVLFAVSSSEQVPYPERSMVFLALSFVGLNVGLLFRAIFSREEIICQMEESLGVAYLTVEGHRNALCFVTFLLVYFFSVCTSSWLLAVSVAW